jgi:hypothetical protein
MDQRNTEQAAIATASLFYIDLTSVVEKASMNNLRSIRNCEEQFLGQNGNIKFCCIFKKLNVER